MSNIDLLALIAYVIVIVLIVIANRTGKFANVFSSIKNVPWWLAGVSYFIISSENVNMLTKMGILIDEGYSGLWLFYSSVLSVGFIPVIFAPLWSRLKFITDNQFILHRFSGLGAKVLHIFRATYVGYLATSIFISLYIAALVKLFNSYLGLSYNLSFCIVAIVAVFVVFKNSFSVKLKTDLFNGIVYFTAFVLGSLFVVKLNGGFNEIYTTLRTQQSESIKLFSNTTNSKTLMNLIVYFGIQWWSINIIDGSGPRAQRFMNVKTRLDAFKTAIFPIIVMSIIFIFKSLVLDTGLYLSYTSPELIPIVNGNTDYEGFFLTIFAQSLPNGINALVFIAFIIGLISVFESLINWGASFVVVDLYSTYINKQAKEKSKVRISYLTMLLIVGTGLLIAWFNNHLLSIQKFIFSMAAGVGPVFILRWFWKRINAWSQLSAMLSSLILTILFDFAFQNAQTFTTLIEKLQQQWQISYYPLKLSLLTVAVSAIWLSVTFLTKPDDKKHLQCFYSQLNLNNYKLNRFVFIWKVTLLLLLPIITILPFIFVWCIKFYSIPLGLALFAMWIICIVMVVFKMQSIYSE